MRRIAIGLVAVAALIAPAAAGAHVSVHPNAVPAGANATLNIRVPNELDNAKTTKVQVKFPPDFIGVSTEPPPGWTSKVRTSKLAKPVQTDDGPIDTQVSEVQWTAGSGTGIPPGQFANFPISVALPGRSGQVLTFKTLQTYSNGQVARWIGAPDSDQPAPTIDVTAKGGVLQDVAGAEAGPGPLPATTSAGQAGTPTATRTVVEKQSASDTLAVIALIVGVLGLAAGAAGLAAARRARGGQRTAV
jgi:periplasmic copper chaperone A